MSKWSPTPPCASAAALTKAWRMRSSHRIKCTTHLVLSTALVGLSSWQLDSQPQSFAWFVAMLLGFLTFVVEIPELARRDDEPFETPELQAQRRAFEDHCRAGGWNDVDLGRMRGGSYARTALNEAWQRWLAQAQTQKPRPTAKDKATAPTIKRV